MKLMPISLYSAAAAAAADIDVSYLCRYGCDVSSHLSGDISRVRMFRCVLLSLPRIMMFLYLRYCKSHACSSMLHLTVLNTIKSTAPSANTGSKMVSTPAFEGSVPQVPLPQTTPIVSLKAAMVTNCFIVHLLLYNCLRSNFTEVLRIQTCDFFSLKTVYAIKLRA